MARPTRGSKKTKATAYEFEMKPVSVVTPLATTHFMCLAETNEVTGNFGGGLLFTDEDLDQEVTFKEWGKDGEKWKAGFFDGVDELIDEALEEYNSNNKKQAVRADKFQTHFDQDDNETDLWEFTIKNKDQPKIVDKFKQRLNDFDELLGNGSKIKVQVNLKPYHMQGKVGVTAYFDYVLIKEIKEYGGGGGGNPFDDEDFEDESCDIPAEDEQEEVEEEAPAPKTRRSRKAKAPEPEPEAEEEETVEEEAPVEKPKRKRRTKAQIEADNAKKAEAEDEAEEVEEAPEEEAPKPTRKRRVRKSAEPETTKGEADDF